MWGNSHQFRYLKEYLESIGYRVVVIDLQGVTFEGYVRQVVACLQTVTGDSILIGHSMGGLIVQKVANLQPEKVRGVVLINSAAPQGVFALSMRLFFTMLCPRYLWAMLTGGNFRIHPHDAKKLMMGGVSGDPEELFPKEENGFLTLRLALSRIKVEPITQPLLVVSGLRDCMTPPKTQRFFKKVYGFPPRFRQLWLPSGHLPMLEEGVRGQLFQIIQGFLSEYGRKRVSWGIKPPRTSVLLEK